ncbi:PSME3-interacting protein isoform X1 [Phycodurus eques]|uniref:PSME3-interacting protein isoform X1 n=1 Tax=Phycodurus eques TaxID=693459 RepID=UPI002ACEA418|nr:PSME3-interacting protein isoform X1 [Phycodurus eques]
MTVLHVHHALWFVNFPLSSLSFLPSQQQTSTVTGRFVCRWQQSGVSWKLHRHVVAKVAISSRHAAMGISQEFILRKGSLSLTLYRHSAVAKQVSSDSRPESEKKATAKQSVVEQRTSHLSQAHLLAGAVKRRSSSQSSDSSKKQKVESAAAGNGDSHTEQEGGGGQRSGGAENPQTVPGLTPKNPSPPLNSGPAVLHLPSAAVCIGVLPGLCDYSGSSDSDSSSDSEV